MIGGSEAATRLGIRSPRLRDRYRTTLAVVAAIAPVTLVGIVLLLGYQGLAAALQFGLGFLVGQAWNPVSLNFGALPFIYGTVVSSLLALALSLPVGVGTAIFLAEQRGAGIRGVIGSGVELLAAIPSVVYGLWALYVMAPFVYAHVELPLQEKVGFIPLFAGPARQTSMLSAALVLAVMILPTLAAVSRDVIKAVPRDMRVASIALGGRGWETTWKVILPAARNGIFGATVLALGRALGETIAVTMVIGNRPEIQASLFAPAYTLASVIANEFTEATGRLYSSALIELGFILIALSLAVNLGALGLVRLAVGRNQGGAR